jgi:hypothetical protein
VPARRDAETEVLREAGGKCAELHGVFVRRLDTIEEHDQTCPASHAAGEPFLALSPTPIDFLAFLEMLRDVGRATGRRYATWPQSRIYRLVTYQK